MIALLGGLLAAACGGTRGGIPAVSPGPKLGLDPIVDLVPAAGLVWLVDARPQALFQTATLGPAIAMMAPEERLAALARRYGGIDLRRVSQLAVAGFPDTTLGLARVPVDPAGVEATFATRARIGMRAVERGVTRFQATAGGEPEQVALFGREGAAVEHGEPGPLQTALYFAEGKLKRALPALKAEPLVGAGSRLGDVPLRAFAPGPFEGRWAGGLGGLLRASTALAAALRAVETLPGAAVGLTLLLLGAWGADAPAAEGRLAAAFHVLSEDPLGRLTGINRPIEAARTSGDASALRLDVVLDLAAIARGLRDATDASVAEIMGK
ncbi:MAG: hypothetical protein ACLP1X_29580 [Polyangiaceae bacterium]